MEARHLAGVLLTFDKMDRIISCWDKSLGVFQGVANAEAIY
jgi:hypothetical protein